MPFGIARKTTVVDGAETFEIGRKQTQSVGQVNIVGTDTGRAADCPQRHLLFHTPRLVVPYRGFSWQFDFQLMLPC